MADTIDIGGKKISKGTAAAIALLAVVVIGVAVYRSKKAAAATTPAAPMVTDPDGNSCSALNPVTGYCPGTPGDIAAQQAGAAAYGNAAGGYGYGPVGPSNTGGGGVPVFTDNGSWGQYAEAQMGSNGADAIAAAIGKYLAGVPVTSDQQTIIQQAIAIANYPPVAGAGGFPPSMHLSSGTTTGGATNPVTGLHASAAATSITLSWTASPGATSYQVTGGNRPMTVTGTSVRIRDLQQHKTYQLQVLAQPAASGATPASISATTK